MNNKTEPFREQHERLLGIVNEISLFLEDSNAIMENSNNISKLLSDLKRNLKVHLTLEDTSLYPILLVSDDERVKNTAEEFMKEMDGINSIFQEYISRWSSGFKIQENPLDFAEETKDLFDSLGKRIEREDNNLYTIIDEMFQ